MFFSDFYQLVTFSVFDDFTALWSKNWCFKNCRICIIVIKFVVLTVFNSAVDVFRMVH